MGYASYFEDIQDRLTSDLGWLKTYVDRPDKGAAELRVRAQALLDACENTLRHVGDLVELATDPHFDLAYEITSLSREKLSLEKEIDSLARRRQALGVTIQSLESERRKLKDQLRHQQRLLKQAEDDFNRLASTSFDAAIDLYSQDTSLQEHKPNA